MSKQSQIREQVTAKIVAALEKDLLPWRRMWNGGNLGQHFNALTGKVYRGVNILLLGLHAAEHNLQSTAWATFNQWKQMGCFVNRRPDGVDAGQWGTTLTAYIPIQKKENEDPKEDDDEEVFWMLKKFVVFNSDQVSGHTAELFRPMKLPETSIPDFEPAEQLLRATGAIFRFGGDRACYRLPRPEGSWPNHTAGDYIRMPPKSFFVGGVYYTTALHELAHWSEVRVGIDREKISYAECELIAEMSSAFLATELGIPNSESIENHASYLKSWLSAMKENPYFIFKVSKQASKVCDFLLSFVRQADTEPKPELVEAA